MEQYLEKIRWNLYCNKQEINISIRFLIILGVLAIFSFFLFKQKWIIFVGAIIAVLIFLHILNSLKSKNLNINNFKKKSRKKEKEKKAIKPRSQTGYQRKFLG